MPEPITWEQLAGIATLDAVMYQQLIWELRQRGLAEGLSFPAVLVVNIGDAENEQLIFLPTEFTCPLAAHLAADLAEERQTALELARLSHANQANKLRDAVDPATYRGISL